MRQYRRYHKTLFMQDPGLFWESSRKIGLPHSPRVLVSGADTLRTPWPVSPRRGLVPPLTPAAGQGFMESIERQLQQKGAGSPVALPRDSGRMQAVRAAFEVLLGELPAHGPLLRQVQREYETVLGTGSMCDPVHTLKPDHRLLLPGPYYQSELKRAEANLRVAISHGPRLRKMVRKLRVGCAEATVRLHPFAQGQPGQEQPSPGASEDEGGGVRAALAARAALARIDQELRGSVDPEDALLGEAVVNSIPREIETLKGL